MSSPVTMHQSDSGRADSLTDWTPEFNRGWNCAGILACCLSFLAKRCLSLCSFLCCSLCATPVWIALLQLGRSLANFSQFSGLIPHCFKLCLRLSLKRFHLPLVSLPYRIFFETLDESIRTKPTR